MIANLLDDVASVVRKTRSDDGQGGFIEAETTIGDAPCRISSMSARDFAIAGQFEAVVSHPIYFMPGTDVRLGDKVVIGGRTFCVRVPNQAGTQHPYMKVLAEEYQVG